MDLSHLLHCDHDANLRHVAGGRGNAVWSARLFPTFLSENFQSVWNSSGSFGCQLSSDQENLSQVVRDHCRIDGLRFRNPHRLELQKISKAENDSTLELGLPWLCALLRV